jgi:single-stranded-DNA-specific exonuclease
MPQDLSPQPALIYALNGQIRRWLVAPAPDESALAALGPLPRLVAMLLHRRGIQEAAAATEFMDTADSLFEDPSLLPDVGPATERIAKAKANGETVAVYGDFDADGVTGTALLFKALRRYGLSVVSYIPHRVTEGHGLNASAIDQLAGQGVRLIITVDCGVTDVVPISHARTLGIDTIITDHHLVAAELPQAIAIINPHAPHSEYGFDHLTGVGMTLKLAQALLEPEYGVHWSTGLLELAAIGTITDMAPLLGENRYIVDRGLVDLSRTRSAGLLALMDVARVEPIHVSAESIGFGIGPRLNAAGRLDHANTALELLTTDDTDRARELVKELNGYNIQRQELTEEVLHASRAQVPASVPAVIVVGSPDFHPGVVGLVAGKLAEAFGVPALCYARDGETIMGSCRTAPGFHWSNALTACDDLLSRYGGHAQAAGFACEARDLPELTERLQAIAAEQMGDTPANTAGTVDAEVSLSELMGPTFQALRRMEPFGIGNPSPLFLTRGVDVVKANPMGADGSHFRLTLRAGGTTWEAVAFRQSWLAGTHQVDLIYTLAVDHWNGQPRLRLTIRDYAPSIQPRLAL